MDIFYSTHFQLRYKGTSYLPMGFIFPIGKLTNFLIVKYFLILGKKSYPFMIYFAVGSI